MTTNNHPAHAPLASRLHQMRDILSKASARRDGGDIGYAMSDAVKLIDEVLLSDPVAPEFHTEADRFLPECLKPEEISGEQRNSRIAELMGWFDRYYNGKANPKWFKSHTAELCYYILTATQPVPVVPEDIPDSVYEILCQACGGKAWMYEEALWNACRAAMLQGGTLTNEGAKQAGNSPVTPDGWIKCSDRMPERDVDVQVYCSDKKEQMVAYVERNEPEGWFRFASLPNGGGVYCKPTHWMPLPASPQQEVKS